MTTIKVLIDTLPGGYGPIIEYYNANKPADWMPIAKAGVAEGGFEIKLNPDELARKMNWYSDYNDRVRQLRWSDGKLLSNCYVGFTDEQTALLFQALQQSLGDQVIML
jgi:hypothetical protein